jgi:hypothetical protein
MITSLIYFIISKQSVAIVLFLDDELGFLTIFHLKEKEQTLFSRADLSFIALMKDISTGVLSAGVLHCSYEGHFNRGFKRGCPSLLL